MNYDRFAIALTILSACSSDEAVAESGKTANAIGYPAFRKLHVGYAVYVGCRGNYIQFPIKINGDQNEGLSNFFCLNSSNMASCKACALFCPGFFKP